MLNLLKADLLRIIKDKLFIIMAIVIGAIGVLLPIGLFGLFYLLAQDGTMVRESISAFDVAMISFGPFNNVGMVLAILLCIVITKDMTNGTIRNKIIMGKSRTEVYFSDVIASVIVIVGSVFVFALISFLVGCCFFNSGFTKDTVGVKLLTILMQLLGWIVLSTALTFFALNMKNAGLAIVCYMVIGLVLTFVGQILGGVNSFIVATNPDLVKVFNVLLGINIPYAMSGTFGGNFLGAMYGNPAANPLTEQVIEFVCSSVVFGSAFVGFGYLIFRNKDLK